MPRGLAGNSSSSTSSGCTPVGLLAFPIVSLPFMTFITPRSSWWPALHDGFISALRAYSPSAFTAPGKAVDPDMHIEFMRPAFAFRFRTCHGRVLQAWPGDHRRRTRPGRNAMTKPPPFGFNMLDSDQFETMYRQTATSHGLPVATPWDIGAAQPAVRRLVALGAIQGEVLDAGTGPGHHAIYLAAQGYSVTGIDASVTAIERARRNAEDAGVTVDFRVADATKLQGLEGRFDTVVDSAFYHLFYGQTELQRSYLKALHTATRAGARLFMLEFGGHNVNGFIMPQADSEELYRQLLPGAGWDVTYFGPTTYQTNFDRSTFERVADKHADPTGTMSTLVERLRTIEPWLDDGRAHAPAWEVHATRLG
jgi:SAM-dependent methyltransferase